MKKSEKIIYLITAILILFTCSFYGYLYYSKEKAESLLLKANIPLETRAEMLDLNQYIELYKALKEIITNER